MLRCALCVGLLGVVTVCPLGVLPAQDTKADESGEYKRALKPK